MGLTDLKTARRAVFYRNGETFARGKQMVVSDRKYPQLASLMNALTDLLQSPISIEKIYDLDRGRLVRDMQDVNRNGRYVCAGREKINKQIDYTRVATPKWHRARRRALSSRDRAKTDPAMDQTRRALAQQRLQPLHKTPKANILICYRNGCPSTEKPRQFVVAAKSAATVEQVILALSQQLNVVGGVRTLFTLEGKRIKEVHQLYDLKYVIACGAERLDRQFASALRARLLGSDTPVLAAKRRMAPERKHGSGSAGKNLRGDRVVPQVHNPPGSDPAPEITTQSAPSELNTISNETSSPNSSSSARPQSVNATVIKLAEQAIDGGVSTSKNTSAKGDEASSLDEQNTDQESSRPSQATSSTRGTKCGSGAKSPKATAQLDRETKSSANHEARTGPAEFIEPPQPAEKSLDQATDSHMQPTQNYEHNSSAMAEQPPRQNVKLVNSSLPSEQAAGPADNAVSKVTPHTRGSENGELSDPGTTRESSNNDRVDIQPTEAAARAEQAIGYLVSQADELDQRTQAERQRQHALAKAKMQQRDKQEVGALELVEDADEKLTQQQQEERRRQQKAFEIKLAESKAKSEPARSASRREQKLGKEVSHKPGTSSDGTDSAPAVADKTPVKSEDSIDLSVSPQEMQQLKEVAATRIQAAVRGHQARAHLKVKAGQAERSSLSAKSHKNQPDLAMSIKTPLTRSETSVETALVGKWQGIVPESDYQQLEITQESKLSFYGIVKENFVTNYLEMHERLGDGNFADVLKCRCKLTGESYACKIIDKRNVPGSREKLMIIHEVRTMRTLKHSGCIKLFDVFETKGKIYLVVELMRDGDLFDHIVKHSKLTEPQAKPMVRDMLKAVAHMHSQGIIHRDLKPENVLLTKDKKGRIRLKLGDFGLAMKVTEPLYAVCGTPTYVAPEIIDQEQGSGYGLPVDLWAIGVITYILLCGFPPFASSKKDQKELFEKIRAGSYSYPKPYWAGSSKSAKNFIDKLLTVDPGERLSAEQALNHDWLR
eukprot:TRINITY_DN11679_c2_g1_i1.p1 TRINITY_DN11679_c2_g1~~TRINITY_DN11679_c2_g1_i1.p1  ORF type:complete len:1004 (+),score=170.13 TRINITY_DN11679_c2_g1_i1:152-3163(+)